MLWTLQSIVARRKLEYCNIIYMAIGPVAKQPSSTIRLSPTSTDMVKRFKQRVYALR